MLSSVYSKVIASRSNNGTVSNTYRLLHTKCDVCIFSDKFGKRTSERSERDKWPSKVFQLVNKNPNKALASYVEVCLLCIAILKEFNPYKL